MRIIRFKTFISCVAAGALIYILDTVLLFLPYADVSSGLFEAIIVLVFASGCVIELFALNFKKPQIKESVVRFLVIIFSYFVFLFFNAYTGNVLRLYDLLNIKQSSSGDNVSGLLMGMFLLVLLAIGIISLLVTAIVKFIKKIPAKSDAGSVIDG